MPAADGSAPVAAPALKVEGVSVRFGGVAALTDVSLAVRPGQVTGLIGPNGAGKTTLFNVVSGLQRPDHGSVLLRGADVTRTRPHQRARMGLARTFQRLELFGTLSAEENVLVGVGAPRRRRSEAPRPPASAGALLERVGLGAQRGELVSALPTGSARLVELARALAIDPVVLLLDEPCSGLDEGETATLGRLLTDLAAEGRAILLVEHDTDLVLRVCDVVHVLDFGEIIATGTPDQIRTDKAVQAAYLGALAVGDQ